MKASIALQVLPLSQGIDRIALIDQVIEPTQTIHKDGHDTGYQDTQGQT